MMHFTEAELRKAWRENLAASQMIQPEFPPSNPRLLLLFYAVECGLKCLLLKRKGVQTTQEIQDELKNIFHDINKILDDLGGNEFKVRLMSNINLEENALLPTRRSMASKQLNELWRYGGTLRNPTQQELAARLETIAQWVQQELL